MAKIVKTKTEFEGRFYDEFVVVEGEGLSSWEKDADLTSVGHPELRIDGKERVTGRALYVSDVQLPGMLYGKIVGSPYPHALIEGIDTRNAEALPGVRAVLTFGNVPAIPYYGTPILVMDREVRFVGDYVACIIADDEDICEDAAALIDVTYKALPFVTDPEEALKPDAPQVHRQGNIFGGGPDIYERGNITEGFSGADVVVEDSFRTQTALHNCLETHGSVAYWEDGRLTIWDSTQNIFGVRQAVADMLKMPLDRVRVIKQYMGGGFGSKNQAGRYTLLAALGSRVTGRPVRILLDRHQENLAAGNRPSSIQRLRIGARNDGTLTAIDLRVISGAGAYVVFPAAVGGPARQLYRCPNVRTEQFTVFLNTGQMAAFRGPGYVEGAFALESLMDDLAIELGMDPLTLRLKNYADEDQVTGRPYSAKRLKVAYERGAELIRWQDREKGPGAGSKLRGKGMASQIWGGNGGPPAYALIKVNKDGTATIVSGTQDIGTGTRTILAQIASEELGIAVDHISVEIGDTQTGPYAPLSAGSMTVASVGPAVRAAARDAREQLLDAASQMLLVPIESLVLKNSAFQSPSLAKAFAIEEVLAMLGDFMVIGKGGRSPNPEDLNVNTFGVQFAEVEVDTETGEVTVERIIAVHDAGRVINPLTISSQVEGGVLQGIGFGLMEDRIIDGGTGMVVNGDLENYLIPTFSDAVTIVPEMIDLPDLKANNLGAKGIGEPPIIPTAPAIANAVANALGKRVKELPITKEKILRVLKG